MTTNPTQPSNAIRDMLIKQACATFKRKFNIDAEDGWFLPEWDADTVLRINGALGLAPEIKPGETLTIDHKGIRLTGLLGHIVVSVMPAQGAATMVYFHNRS